MPTSMVMARTFCGVMPKRRAARWPKGHAAKVMQNDGNEDHKAVVQNGPS